MRQAWPPLTRSVNLMKRLGLYIERNLHPKPHKELDTPGAVSIPENRETPQRRALRQKGRYTMEGRILYFETPGRANTEATLRAARQRAEALGIRQVVVASTHGYTAKQAKAIFAGLAVEIIAVPICASFAEEGWTMSPGERAALEALGIKVLASMHSLGDDVNDAFGGPTPNKVVRETLYRFCQGMKVAVEVAIMAADAGLLDMSREIIAVAGSSEGADTAIVLKPAYARRFTQLEIREILAKPRNA